jgi:hypothetical protein
MLAGSAGEGRQPAIVRQSRNSTGTIKALIDAANIAEPVYNALPKPTLSARADESGD